jgi:hypothetical protein
MYCLTFAHSVVSTIPALIPFIPRLRAVRRNRGREGRKFSYTFIIAFHFHGRVAANAAIDCIVRLDFYTVDGMRVSKIVQILRRT